MLRGVCVAADGDELAAEVMVALQYFTARVRLAKAVFQAAGVQLQAFAAIDQPVQDWIDVVGVAPVRVFPVAVRAVAHDVVEMAECIKVRVPVQILTDFIKIPDVACLFTCSLEKRRVIRIPAVDEMLGSDDKVKRILCGKRRKKLRTLRLDAEFQSDADIDHIPEALP